MREYGNHLTLSGIAALELGSIAGLRYYKCMYCVWNVWCITLDRRTYCLVIFTPWHNNNNNKFSSLEYRLQEYSIVPNSYSTLIS